MSGEGLVTQYTVTVDVFPGARHFVRNAVPLGMWLLIGSPGVGKTTFCRHFAVDGLKVGQDVVYLCTDEAPSSVRDAIKGMAPSLGDEVVERKLRIVDCYSWRLGEQDETGTRVANPSNLTEVSIAIEDARKDIKGFRTVLDSLSSLAVSANPEPFRKFLHILSARLKGVGAAGVFTLEHGVHEERFVNYLRFALDGVFEMSLSTDVQVELSRYFRVFSLRGVPHETKPMAFQISQSGINFQQLPFGSQG